MKMTETKWTENVSRFVIGKFLPIAIHRYEKLIYFSIRNGCGLVGLTEWCSRKNEEIPYPVTLDEKIHFINEFAESSVWKLWERGNVAEEIILTYIITDVVYKTSLVPVSMIIEKYKLSESFLNDILFVTSKYFNPTIFNWEDEESVINLIKSSYAHQVKTKVNWNDVYNHQEHIPVEDYKPLQVIKKRQDGIDRRDEEYYKKLEKEENKYSSLEEDEKLWTKKQLRAMEEFIDFLFDM